MYSGDDLYGDEITSPLYRPQAPRDLPGDAMCQDYHAARICYQKGWNADSWRERYFRTNGEAHQAKRTFLRAGYRIAVQIRHADGQWIG